MTTRITRDPIVVADDHWKAHGWDTGTHFRAALSLYRVDDLLRERTEQVLKQHNLTRAKHEGLAVLYFSRHDGMPLGKLSERLFVHPTSVTSTVDALERLGLVRRVSHPTDRRTTLARITPKGRRTMERTCTQLAELHCGLDPLDAGEAEQLFDILVKVRADAGDLKRPDDDEAANGDPILEAEHNWQAQGWDAQPWLRASLSVYRTAELIRQTNEITLRGFKLTHVRHEALAILFFSRGGEMKMGQLGEHLLVHPTSVTSTVDTLQRLGYVRRVPHPTDRRTTLARLTPKGRRATEAGIQGMADAGCGVGPLSKAQARTVFNLLAKVRLDA